MDNGVPYTTCCVLLSITGLWMFMVSFCMCRKQDKSQADAHGREDVQEGDFDEVIEPHYPPNYSDAMQGDGTRLGGQESADGKSPSQQRAEAMEKKREEAKYRGISKESRIEMQMKQRRMEEAEKLEEERGPGGAMKWSQN